ncbi:MAG: hypothetical protein RI973_2101 [Bacteroidota bacterium]
MKVRITKNLSWPGTTTLYLQIRTLSAPLLILALLMPLMVYSQTESSALFEVQSTDKGFLLPRMTQAQRDVIDSPATGLMIYNTSSGVLEMNLGTPSAPNWISFAVNGKVTALDCAGATMSGTLAAGQPASGVFVSIPYSGGDGGSQAGLRVVSSGVTGLTATLAPGSFANGNGSLDYRISGTPASVGTASFALNAGGQNCTLNLTVTQGAISTLQCNSASILGNPLVPFQPATGVIAIVPYTGGNGSANTGQTVSSAGVAGLTATLAAGNFTTGIGTLPFVISGIPANAGIASFALNIGGQSCSLDLPVNCGAYLAPGTWKSFMCHNLAVANTSAYPFQPSWEIVGGYFQWGRKGPDPMVWLNTNTEDFAHGPTGPDAGQANEASIGGWNQTFASNGAWLDASKTVNDPCPAGFRLPTKAQWDAVFSNNTQSTVGTWTSSPTNYSSGRFIGPGLFLPVTGYRIYNLGALFSRGDNGFYWSSTENGSVNAWYLFFSSSSVNTYYNYRSSGISVRCVSE